MNGCSRWLREAMSDESGQGDIAYGAIGALTGAAIGAMVFICAMAAISYFRCIPLVTPLAVVNCTFDPLPMGQALGLIFGAFATLIGSLCGYMLSTRKPRTAQPDQTVFANSAVVHQEAAQPMQPSPIVAADAATDVDATTLAKSRKKP